MANKRYLNVDVDPELGAALDFLRGDVPMTKYVRKALRAHADTAVINLDPPARREYDAMLAAQEAKP